MKDDWVKAALSNDSVVVDLLLRLKQPSLLEFCKPPPSSSSSSLFLPQGWGKHQPRSRFAVCANTSKKHYGVTSSVTRRSPTTPLSWSGGGAAGSLSDGNFDGHSDSDRAFSDLSRSKDECTNISSMSKSFGKRKALCELEDENNLPLKERVHLSKKLKLMSMPEAHLQQQRVRSLICKTTKFDTVIQRLETNKTSAAAALTSRVEAEKFKEQQQKRFFILPDLNTMPAPEGDDI